MVNIWSSLGLDLPSNLMEVINPLKEFKTVNAEIINSWASTIHIRQLFKPKDIFTEFEIVKDSSAHLLVRLKNYIK